MQIEGAILQKLSEDMDEQKSDNDHKCAEVKIERKNIFQKVLGTIMTQIVKHSKHTQVSVKEGILRYRDKAVEAV